MARSCFITLKTIMRQAIWRRKTDVFHHANRVADPTLIADKNDSIGEQGDATKQILDCFLWSDGDTSRTETSKRSIKIYSGAPNTLSIATIAIVALSRRRPNRVKERVPLSLRGHRTTRAPCPVRN